MSQNEHAGVTGRRRVISLLGAAGAAGLFGRVPLGAAEPLVEEAAPGRVCVVRPPQVAGPFFVDEKLLRSDIRIDTRDGSERPGVPLDLTFRVTQGGARACTPLSGALVDVWHSDARGTYSDTDGKHASTFLRGYQVTDSSGEVHFKTIYPGWYGGRTVHLHFKIRSGEGAAAPFEFTSELYFDEATSDAVYGQTAYAGRGRRTTRNADDWMFQHGGRELLLPLQRKGAGFAGTMDVTLQA